MGKTLGKTVVEEGSKRFRGNWGFDQLNDTYPYYLFISGVESVQSKSSKSKGKFTVKFPEDPG